MTIWFDNRTENPIFEDYKKLLEKIVEVCIEEEKYPENVEVSISIVNNAEIQELNKQFRNIDKSTDVLSFPMIESPNQKMHLNIDTNEFILGDIVISIEKAIEQADEFEHSLQREIAFLTAHSMFHLMGYDHLNIEDEKIMKHKQETVLFNVGLSRYSSCL